MGSVDSEESRGGQVILEAACNRSFGCDETFGSSLRWNCAGFFALICVARLFSLQRRFL